jgi:ribosome maturation factor RimP
VSRTVDPVLEVEDLVDGAYHLEVSSPGLDRPLRKPADFARYAGQRAKVRTHGPVETGTGPRRNWSGILKGFADGMVEIDVDGRLHRIPHHQIAKAHLEYDFEAGLRRKE